MTQRILLLAAVVISVASASLAETPQSIHPTFPLLDDSGTLVQHSKKPVATRTTCGACHDVGFIQSHSSHVRGSTQVTCLDCHLPVNAPNWLNAKFAPNGDLLRESVLVQKPRVENCARCHGVTHFGSDPLVLPQAWEGPGSVSLTLRTGEIISPQFISRSALNLEHKEMANAPWDIHAARQVTCVACHYPQNDPRRLDRQSQDLNHLKFDPRQGTFGDFLKRPDHQLASTNCTSCHDPFAKHEMLPYQKRHFDALACQTCHVPSIAAPVARAIDRTVVFENGEPRVTYRNVASGADRAGSNTNLNSAFVVNFTPVLLKARGESEKLAPFNIQTEWRWIDEANSEPVRSEILSSAFLDGHRYRPDVIKVFDQNQNGQIETNELVLDTESKQTFVRERLMALGIRKPVLRGEINAFPIAHGVQRGSRVTRDCASCHTQESRLGLGLSVFEPGDGPKGVSPVVAQTAEKILTGLIETSSDGRIVTKPVDRISGRFIFGFDRLKWIDVLGWTLVGLIIAGSVGHGILRLRSKAAAHSPKTKRVYIYSFYERFWHWLNAFGIMLMIYTGFEIHYSGQINLMSFSSAVWVHTVLAGVLITNAGLSLFYHLASGEIRQFLPQTGSFFEEALAQLKYYMGGVFRGEPHPLAKSAERKLNPLQQVTYLLLLNILLPMQFLTGILIWAADRWPESVKVFGGLGVLAPVHTLGSWLFVVFLAMHVYLTTTGHTVLSNIKAMIVGIEEIEIKDSGDLHSKAEEKHGS